MGMLLRRKDKIPEVLPKVNGKPIINPPKTRSLTEKNKLNTQNQTKM